MSQSRILRSSVVVAIALALCLSAALAANPNTNRQEAVVSQSPLRVEGLAMGNQVILPPAAFSSDGYEPGGYFMSFAGGYITESASSTGGTCLLAPIHFPAGATTIKSVTLYVEDTNASESQWFDFYRINLATGTPEMLGEAYTVDSVGAAPLPITLSSKSITPAYAYQLTTCLSSGVRLYGAIIKFGKS